MNKVLVALAIVIVIGCSDVEDPTSVKIDDIVQLKVTGPSSIRADAVSTTTVQATIPEEATKRNVKFTTTHGTFDSTGGKAEITVTADAQGHASATIIAGREAGVSNVTASIDTFVTSVNIPHERAFAQMLTAETSVLTVKKSGTNATTSATITAILTRQTGVVSTGTRATFEAFERRTDGSRGGSVGRFISIGVSDLNGRLTAVYSAEGAAEAVAAVTIVISAQTDSGSTISTELILDVVP